jgi:sec-independent protein translocase protein TatC
MNFGRLTSLLKNDGKDEYNDPPRPFIEHLMDLRNCLIRCAVAWVICVLVVIPIAPYVCDWLKGPADQYQNSIQGLTLTIGFDLLFKIMLWGGTTLSLPFLFFYLSRFIFPGLKRSEQTLIIFCLITATVLFVGGVWMAYAATLKVAFRVFQQVNAWMHIPVSILTLNEYAGIVMKTIIAFGLAFQLPLLLLALGWIGVISSKSLVAKRRLAIVIIFVISMVLTPPDPVSQIVMAIPMCLLYEVCIWLIRLREKARGIISDDEGEKKEPQDGTDGKAK